MGANNLTDQTVWFFLGQDSYNEPDKVAKEGYAKGINVKTDRGAISPRWGKVLQNIQFPNKFFRNKKGLKRFISDLFSTGRFQALIPCYVPDAYYLIIIIGGFIFRYNIDNQVITLLSETIKTNANHARINWSVADKYIVVFDYPNNPIIIDDTEVYRSDDNFMVGGTLQPQVPVSVLGTYNQSRLAIANAGNEFTLGDPVGNLATPYAPITFTEVFAPASAYLNQFFSLDTNSNREPITAMGFIQTLDEGTGVGPLLVGSKNATYYFRTDLPRAQWTQTRFGAIYTYNVGIAGQRAFTNLNSDVYFLSPYGEVYTVSTARNDANKWSNVSISREVENFLKYDDIELAQFAAVGNFKNKVFVTANPYRVEALDFDSNPIYDVAHGGMVCMSLDNVATFRSPAPPVWDGLWTGFRPMDMCTVNGRFFVISKDDNKINRLYEFKPELTYDIGDKGIEYIKSILYTREYDCGDGFFDKEMFSLTIPFTNVRGEFKARIDYKPSQYENYSFYEDFSHNAPANTCNFIKSLNRLAGHNFKNLIFTPQIPKTQCDPVSGEKLISFRKMQFRLQMEGLSWVLPELKLSATSQATEERNTACKKYNESEIIQDCAIDWLTNREIKKCQ